MRLLKFVSHLSTSLPTYLCCYYPTFFFSNFESRLIVIASLKHYSFKAQIEYLFKKKLATFF